MCLEYRLFFGKNYLLPGKKPDGGTHFSKHVTWCVARPALFWISARHAVDHRRVRIAPSPSSVAAVPAGGLRARSVDSSRGRGVDIRFSTLVVPRCRWRRHVRRGTPARGGLSVRRGRRGGIARRAIGDCSASTSMPVRTGSPAAAVDDNSTICNGGQPLVGAPGSHHPRLGAGPMCPMVPHLHNDPFYCSPFGNPYYRWGMVSFFLLTRGKCASGRFNTQNSLRCVVTFGIL